MFSRRNIISRWNSYYDQYTDHMNSHERNIVLVWVGGTGMSGLALFFHQLWYTNIVGIDAQRSQITDRLSQLGIPIIIGHGHYTVKHQDRVIYSNIASIKQSPELQQSFVFQQNRTKKHYHKPFTYNEFVGELSKYFRTIGIAWSNGKSSVTSLAIYTASKLLPDFGMGIVGAMVPQFDGNSILINHAHRDDIAMIVWSLFSPRQINNPWLLKKYWFIVESCEFNHNFLLYDLDYTIVTNISRDHTDYFLTEQSYHDAFKQLTEKTKLWVITQKTIANHQIDYDILFGHHRQINGNFVIRLCQTTLPDLSVIQINEVMSTFKWLRRRMELLTNKPIIYSDYAHHPDALRVVHQSLHTRYPDKKLRLIFQPHQAQRVLHERDWFIEACTLFDESLIYSLYTAREDLAALQQQGQDKQINFESFEQLGELFAQSVQGTYIADNKQTQIDKYLTHNEESIITVICTAGDLDFLVRQQLHLLDK